ncbi:hypothetical protein J6590_039621 [Homalodisca vitripennis]|nr:hypothetical protein J6590_039621 [Homalodisca vitripennis]
MPSLLFCGCRVEEWSGYCRAMSGEHRSAALCMHYLKNISLCESTKQENPAVKISSRKAEMGKWLSECNNAHSRTMYKSDLYAHIKA